MAVRDFQDLKPKFETLLKDAEREPVPIQKDGGDVAVVLSPAHFQALKRPSSRI